MFYISILRGDKMVRFKHLKVPDHWQQYWTKYPEGYTILEALIDWVSQVDKMVDSQNNLLDSVEQFRVEIDDFIGQFDQNLQQKVVSVLEEWQHSGFLEIVISEALQTQIDDVEERVNNKVDLQTEVLLVNVPSDFDTLQSAIDVLSRKYAPNRTAFIINIEAGHKLTNGLIVENGDYGNFIIKSEDSVVELDSNYTGAIYEDPGAHSDIEDFLVIGVNARMPVLDCLIDMGNKGSVGYYATKSSSGEVTEGSGVINAPFVGIEARTSTISAQGTITSGSRYGYRAQQGGVLFAQESIAEDCIETAVLASRGSTINFASGSGRFSLGAGIIAQRSKVICMHANVSDTEGIAIQSSGASSISASSCIVSRSGRAFQAQGGSVIDATGAVANRCDRGLLATRGSTIIADNGEVNNCRGTALYALNNSKITFNKGYAENSGEVAIHSENASTIEARGARCSDSEDIGLFSEWASTINFAYGFCDNSKGASLVAMHSSTINAPYASVTGSEHDTAAVQSQFGSHINCVNADASGSVASFNVFAGSFIYARDAVGNSIQDENVLSDRGIVFR